MDNRTGQTMLLARTSLFLVSLTNGRDTIITLPEKCFLYMYAPPTHQLLKSSEVRPPVSRYSMATHKVLP
jgi:hypothetical protein